jgi:PAS domain-containing protein
MWRNEIEVILARQLASYLTMPIFIVDPDGTLLYFNEPAEVLLGKRFDETGKMVSDEWMRIFHPRTVDGDQLDLKQLPLVVAIERRRPAHLRFWIQGLDGINRHLEVTAVPLNSIGNRFVGAVAIFWEVENE